MNQNQERFYIELREARRVLKERVGLRRTVEKHWEDKGLKFPHELANTNLLLAFLARHLATARYEDLAFVLLTEKAGLQPIWLTYTADRFVTCSPVKVSYLQPRIVKGFGRRCLIVLKYQLANPKVADRNRMRLCDIRTYSGEPLVDWHRRLFEAVYPGARVVDLSEPLQALGKAKDYYPLFLSLAVAHGVLFEDYHGGESGERLNSFTEEVFEPAFEEVINTFGAPPLIVKLPWWRELGYYVSLELAKDWHIHGIILKDLLS